MTEDMLELVLKITTQGADALMPVASRLKEIKNQLDRVKKASGGMLNLGSIFGRVGGLLRGAGGMFLSLAQTAFSAISSIVGAVGRLVSMVGQVLVSAIQRAGQAFVALGVGAAATLALVANKGVQWNAQMEQLKTSFETLLGSPQAAQGMMQFLQQFADKTSFLMPEVARAGKVLSAFGLDVTTWLDRAGNLAAGMGVKIEEVATALGRLSAGETGEAFERLRELGIAKPLLLAQGLQFDKGGQLTSSAEEAMDAVARIIDERFGGLMEKQSRTLAGVFSTLTDKWDSFIGAVTGGLAGRLRDGIAQLLAFLDRLQSTETWGKIVAAMSLPFDLLGGLFQWVIAQVPALVDSIASGFESGAIQNAIMTLANWILAGFRVVGGAVSGVIAILRNGLGSDIVQAAKAAWNGIKEMAKGAVGFIVPMVQQIAEFVAKAYMLDAVLQSARLNFTKAEWSANMANQYAAYAQGIGAFGKNAKAALEAETFGTQAFGVDFGAYGKLFQQAYSAFGQNAPTAEALLAFPSPRSSQAAQPEGSEAPMPAPVSVNAPQVANVSVSFPGAVVNAPEELAAQAAQMAYDQTLDALTQMANGTTAQPTGYIWKRDKNGEARVVGNRKAPDSGYIWRSGDKDPRREETYGPGY